MKNISMEKFHRLFYPSLTVIVVAEAGGVVGGMAAVTVVPVSFNPPMVGVSVSPGHQTHKLIAASRCFSVNWLDFKHASRVGYLGEVSGEPSGDKLKAAGLSAVRGRVTPTPIVKEAVAVLECRVATATRTGDHDWITAQVEAAYAAGGFQDYWSFKKYHPTLYVGKGLGSDKSGMFLTLSRGIG